LPWYLLSPEGTSPFEQRALEGTRSYRGWEVGFVWSWVPVLLSVAVAAVCGLRLRGRSLPEVPLPWHQLTLIAALLAGYVTVLRFVLSWSPRGIDLDAIGYTSDRQEGLYLALVAAGLLLWGAVLRARAARRPSPSGS
jgi:hypothetical protein